MPRQDEPGTELWQLIRSIYRSSLKKLNARLAKERITFPQYNVLLALAREGPMQMNRLSEHMLVAPANMTGLIDRMEKKGYVRRTRSPEDRRLLVVEPTELGSTVYRKISGRFVSYVKSIGQDLPAAELGSTVESLRKIMDTVEKAKEI
jgi:DNA-binding MarR family transcriptional regulator